MLSCYNETDSLTTYKQAQNVNTMFPALLDGYLKQVTLKDIKTLEEWRFMKHLPTSLSKNYVDGNNKISWLFYGDKNKCLDIYFARASNQLKNIFFKIFGKMQYYPQTQKFLPTRNQNMTYRNQSYFPWHEAFIQTGSDAVTFALH